MVLFVGRIVPEKNVAVLARALARLAAKGERFRLLLCGDGPDRPAVEAALGARSVSAEIVPRHAGGRDRAGAPRARADRGRARRGVRREREARRGDRARMLWARGGGARPLRQGPQPPANSSSPNFAGARASTSRGTNRKNGHVTSPVLAEAASATARRSRCWIARRRAQPPFCGAPCPARQGADFRIKGARS